MANKEIDLKRVRELLGTLVLPEIGYVKVVAVYGITISLLTLAVPIAVQTLINTVANIASTRAILALSGVLLLTLVVSGALNALRNYIMEMYERRIYARLTSELSLRTILAPHAVFEGRQNATLTQYYFEIMTLQKNIPSLLVDGFALLLQLLVGFTLVSFYHPMLFAFNIVIILFIYLIWVIWGAGAKRTAIELSYAKYNTAKWLNELSASHEFFKSSQHMDYAARTTEGLIEGYVSSHKRHFAYTFSQVIAFLVLYAGASASLLGLGGWLVIRGELSIGQLVAAELIMSAVFFGLSQFANYMQMYYELYGAADKLGQLLTLPQEELHEDSSAIQVESTIEAGNLTFNHEGRASVFSFKVEAGAKAFVVASEGWIQRRLTKLIKLHQPADGGWLRLGDYDLSEYDVYELRQAIAIIDRSLIVECTITDFFRLAAPQASLAEIRKALELVGLYEVITTFPDGVDTKLSSLGLPLLPLEFLLVKLAAAIVADSKIVVLNQDFDNLRPSLRDNILRKLEPQPFTVLYFTNNSSDAFFDGTLRLSGGDQANTAKRIEITRKSI